LPSKEFSRFIAGYARIIVLHLGTVNPLFPDPNPTAGGPELPGIGPWPDSEIGSASLPAIARLQPIA
jgi:hypothetical protein